MNQVSDTIEQPTAPQQQLGAQHTEALRLPNLSREKILDRLWQIANLSPEMTRGSMTAQMKALSMIVAMEGFIPDRRAEKKSTPAPDNRLTHPAAWPAKRQEKDEPGLAESGLADSGLAEPQPAPQPAFSSAADAPNQSVYTDRVSFSAMTPSEPFGSLSLRLQIPESPTR